MSALRTVLIIAAGVVLALIVWSWLTAGPGNQRVGIEYVDHGTPVVITIKPAAP